MNEELALIPAFLFMQAAMAWFALSLPAHWKQAGFSTELPELRLRTQGWSGMLLSAIFCLLADHPSMAVLVWIMMIPLCATLTAFTLSYRPRLLRLLAATPMQ